ncbi:hypothetical protein JCM9492_05340 [Aquifex pyrophilus]
MKVFLYDTNLILSSRIKSQLKNLNAELVKKEDVGEDTVALINLESPKAFEVLKELKEKGAKVIGYCGHKNISLIEEARKLGADEVVPNSRIAGDLRTLLG